MNLGRETEYLEFKETTSELEAALIDICAMLNKHGRGVLYFGAKNNGDVRGFQIGDSTERDISRKIYESIKPQIYPDIETEMIDESKGYIKVSFEGTNIPYSAFGRYYMRVADESRELNPDELSQIIMSVNYKSWERKASPVTVDRIDEKTLKEFFNDAVSCDRLPKTKYNKKQLLEKLNLLSEDKKYLNNAGRYLFSSDEPIELKMGVFATDEKNTLIDINPVKGNIFQLLKEAENYIKKNIHWSVDVNGFYRNEIPEIPVEALREIIVNSFAHADYLGWSKNEIDIHPGRVAIYNPGAFPDEFVPEDFVERDISSKIRNEIICDVLYKCRAVETWGTGLKKTYRLCKEAEVRVGYQKEVDGFWFFFYRNSAKDGTNDVTNSISDKNNDQLNLSELEMIILSEIEKNDTITRQELSKTTGRSVRTIQRTLENLKEKKRLERIGSARSGQWLVKKQLTK